MQTSNILFFYQGNMQQYVCERIASFYEKKGYRICLLDVDGADLVEEIKAQLAYPTEFVFSFNGKALDFTLNTQSLVDYLECPVVTLLSDPPYNNVTNKIFCRCKNLIVLYLGKSHLQFLNAMFPPNHIKTAVHMPWGGIQGNAAESMSKEKKFDIVFCATNYGLPKRSWQQSGSEIADLLDDVADHIISAPYCTILSGFQFVLQNRGIYDPKFLNLCMQSFGLMYFYIRTYRRIKCMETAVKSGLRIDVFGNGWEIVGFADKLKIHGAIDYETSAKVYANAKVILNEGATFDDGIHDRVFSGMLNGAAIVSDYSTCLADEFVVGEDLEVYGWDHIDEMPLKIVNLLIDEEKRISMARSAYGKVIHKHTWKERAKQILEIVQVYRFMHGMNKIQQGEQK